MNLPYITKYNCGHCNKEHRLSFKQWYEVVSKMADYIEAQKNASDLDTALDRAEKYKGWKIDRRDTLANRISKWLMKW